MWKGVHRMNPLSDESVEGMSGRAGGQLFRVTKGSCVARRTPSKASCAFPARHRRHAPDLKPPGPMFNPGGCFLALRLPHPSSSTRCPWAPEEGV